MKQSGLRRAALALAAWLGWSWLLAGTAQATPHRFAFIVANNTGSRDRPALRFAEEDARRLARVLIELGGFAQPDVEILLGSSLGEVRAAMKRMQERIGVARSRAGDQALFVVYYSGHSDGEALELGPTRLQFAELRRWVRDTPADIRIAVVDSCRSGGLVQAKGGTLSPRFDLHFENELASAGEVLITSSAADELALESAELRASYFSHHLVSGLRGAADISGDGDVTLTEAYQYAFDRTVSTTANTVVGPQHPVYDYKLAGKGDVVLTRLQRPSAVVDLPPRFDRVLVMNEAGVVVVEVAAGGARRVGLPPGRYRLRAWRGSSLRVGQVELGYGETVTVAEEQLTAAAWSGRDTSKGGGGAGPTLVASGGATVGLGDDAKMIGALRLDASFGVEQAVALSLIAGTAQTERYRESRFELGAAWRWPFGSEAVSVLAGAYAGVGLELQQASTRSSASTSDDGGRYWTGMAVAGPTVALQWWMLRDRAWGDWGVALRADANLGLFRRDDATVAGFVPSAWLGIAFRPWSTR